MFSDVHQYESRVKTYYWSKTLTIYKMHRFFFNFEQKWCKLVYEFQNFSICSKEVSMTGKITSEFCTELLIFGVINCVLHVNTDADYKLWQVFPSMRSAVKYLCRGWTIYFIPYNNLLTDLPSYRVSDFSLGNRK